MQRVAMILSNAFQPDPRVAREAGGLARAGYELTVVCWDREGSLAAHETRDGYRVERVQHIRTRYGSGPRQIFYTPRFWSAAARSVAALKPAVIHCHDLDTLAAGWWLKRRLGTRLVYDAHEDYPALMSLYLPSPMVRVLSWLERRLLGRVDCAITASTVFADKLRNWGLARVVTIGNYAALDPFDRVAASDVLDERQHLGLAPNDYVVAYVGGFTRNRVLLPLIEAARSLKDVQVLLWGDGHQRAVVEAAAAGLPNVRYLGWLPAGRVPLISRLADVVYYCLVPNYPGAVYNAPNTLSHTMAAGRPIIANDVGDLGRVVRETGCGLLLDTVTPDSIGEAIDRLRDPALRERLGAAGRAAAETRYNWANAERLLLQTYTRLLEER